MKLKRTGLIIFLYCVYFAAYAQKKTVIPVLDKDKSEQPVNVIFILSDDHRYDFIGFTGRIPWLKTPNMDRMAAEGAYFKNAFVTTSLCSPSRASILTGQYSHVHTVVDNQAPDPPNLIFFPQYLQKAGYQTSFFGKWHMGSDSDMPRPGFDHWESFKGQGVYWNPELNIDGKEVQYQDSTYITDLLTEHALSWLNQRDKKKPFFLYLSHKAVHEPWQPAKRHKGMYNNLVYPLPDTYYQTSNDDYKNLNWPEWVKKQRYSWHGVDFMYHEHQDFQQYVRNYCETLMGVDESIGSVLDYLKANGLEKNTIVIYMGDNGFSFGEHGLIDKRHFYEESVKVPFLMYGPGLFKGGQKVDKMIQNIDVAPTILNLAGLKKPSYMPGSSITPLLQGDTSHWRNKIFYEYYWEFSFPMTPTIFGERSDHYKYIKYQGIWDTNELYDIKTDPDELHNLAGKKEYEKIEKEMAEDIAAWLTETKGLQIPLKNIVKHPTGDYLHPANY